MTPTMPDIAAELAREAAARRTAYPALVDRMRMTQAGADLEIALADAWAADLARYAAWMASPPPRAPMAPVARSAGFTWAERRAGLTRELDRRARLYPKWIAAGGLDQAEADRRIARLSAMADLYDEGHDWHDSFGTRPPFGARFAADDHTPAEAEAVRQWWAHVRHVHTARAGGQPQEQLAL